MRPQSPEVYRRRRIVALVLLVLVLALVVGLVGWIISLFRPGGDEQSGNPGGNASPSVTAPASPTGATGTDTPAPASPTEATGTDTPGTADPASGEPTADPSDSASPSATAGSLGATACQPGDLVISGATDRQSYPEGEDPVLELRVDNTGDEPCAANLGTSQQVFTVYSGSDRIFSTQDCQVEGDDAMMEISPDDQERSRFTWPRVRSAPGCAEVGSEPRSGTYRLEVSLGELQAQPVSFTLQ
ncbi:hypothetical protein [Citricoccus sp.]|nr:hypothetical protein [Citricoccus sp.]HRO30774.1 hypothetical protein [Citricoccus sp.]HRO93836.1 hypothetical protein [Citricoccus sp.]